MSLLDDAFALITVGTRSIGMIIPDVVVQEAHRDDLIITDHPVETGAAISDHAFKRPSEIEMHCGWSDATAGTSGYVQEVYQSLLALQAAREPFDVTTGKRSYSNMLLSSIALTTDQKTENALMVTARLREVLIVSTQMTQSPASAQRNPASTSGPANVGTVAPSPNSGFAPPSVRQ